jgi:uncharacterized protein (DUF2336 family)
MNVRQTLIEELEAAIANSDVRQRADVLRRVTDLFAAGSSGYSKEQVALFDDVMCRLVDEVESSARATFGKRLAAMEKAPPNLVRTLALDDSIDVAGPILAGCEAIDEASLIESAKTKGQDHLLAISQRRSLDETVTDVLVDRGDRQVAISTVVNPGARFSEFGYSTLIKRSENDGDLALRLWSRRDIPRQHLLRLFAESSEAVRRKIQTADRRNADLVRDLIAEAASQLQARSRDDSPVYKAARDRVETLQRSGQLDEAHLFAFAQSEKFDETALALSRMCDLPIGVIERAMVNDGTEQIIVLAKAVGLSWQTTKAILAVRPGGSGTLAHHFEQILSNFNKLKPETAGKAIQFYRMRERASHTASA